MRRNLEFKTQRTKQLLEEFKEPSRFSSDEIKELFDEESHRMPAHGSKHSGLDQQEE